MGDTYDMKYECSNCLRGFLVEIPRKQEALQFLECPICGMNTVSKTNKNISWLNVYTIMNERLEAL